MKFLRLMVLVGFAWGCVRSVLAQENIVISPPFVEVKIEKSNSGKAGEVWLTNNTNQPLDIELSVVDFGSLDESGGIAFLAEKKTSVDHRYGLASWLKTDRNKLVLPPNEKQKISFYIEDKTTLSPGGHYAAILAKVVNNSKATVGLNQSISTLIYAQKVGGELPALRISKTEFAKNWLRLPGLVGLKMENYGNVHLVPRGKVEIFDWQKEIVAKGIINASSSIIMPESFRYYRVPMSTFGKMLWPGKYELRVSYRFDGNEEFKVETTRFYFVGLLASIILVAVVLICIVSLLKHRRKF